MIWDWLSASLDASRVHEISAAQSWHGRFMMLAWGIAAPLGILIARYLKVVPGQNWPQELDNRFWWRSHLVLQLTTLAASLLGFILILWVRGPVSPTHLHAWAGWCVVIGVALQAGSGFLRGSKGGPTSPLPDGSMDGDHYAMTPRRRVFEAGHKALGYLLLGVGSLTLLQGLWLANAPRWMALVVVGFWLLLLVSAACLGQRPKISTYQAIWGPDPRHPGNREG